MTSVLYIYRRNRVRRYKEWQEGRDSSEFLYGYPYLSQERYHMSFVEGDDQNPSWKRKLCFPLEHWLSKHVGIGFGLHIAWMHWSFMRKADVILSTVDTCGLPVAMLKSMGLLKGRLIYVSQGLSDRLDKDHEQPFWKHRLRRIYQRFFKAVDKIVVLGHGARQSFIQTFSVPTEKVTCAPFGVDTDFWQPSLEPSGDYIFSIGSDQGRDYATLLAAVGQQPLQIVTRLDLSAWQQKDNTHISSQHSPLALRVLYQKARYVVIPLKDMHQPSGQSATLQAMACGKAVILTHTRGLWEPEHMRHNENCILVPPGDVAAMTHAMRYLDSRPSERDRIGRNARKTVEERYQTRHFAKSLDDCIQDVL